MGILHTFYLHFHTFSNIFILSFYLQQHFHFLKTINMHFLTMKPSIYWFSCLNIGKVSSGLLFIVVSLTGERHWSPRLLSLRMYSHLSSILLLSQKPENLRDNYWICFQSENCSSNRNYQHLKTSAIAAERWVRPFFLWRITLWAYQIWSKSASSSLSTQYLTMSTYTTNF